MWLDCLSELREFLNEEPEGVHVVVMPDFFRDRLISLDWNTKTFSEKLAQVAKKKGGSLDGIVQTDLRGGNAINTASALTMLGVHVTPMVCTDKLGLRMIKFHLRSDKIDFSHVKLFDKPSITTAFEFKTESGRANIMLRDVGDLADFGPNHLNDDDLRTIEDADYVCVFNWAGTKKFGTRLAASVFRRAKKKGKAKTYFDTADPAPNQSAISLLVKKVLLSKYVDILSVNENEAISYAKQLRPEPRVSRLEEAAREGAKFLAKRLSARVDLHTTGFAGTFRKNDKTTVPAFKVPVLRATGSGDAWNAGNIVGDAAGLSDECRLVLANALAAYYISSPNGTHPSRKQLTNFLEKMEPKTKP